MCKLRTTSGDVLHGSVAATLSFVTYNDQSHLAVSQCVMHPSLYSCQLYVTMPAHVCSLTATVTPCAIAWVVLQATR